MIELLLKKNQTKKSQFLSIFDPFLADPFQLSHFSQHFSSHNPQFVFPHADSAFHKYQQHHSSVHHGSKNKDTNFSDHGAKSVSWSNDDQQPGKQKQRRSNDKNAPEYLI